MTLISEGCDATRIKEVKNQLKQNFKLSIYSVILQLCV